MAQPINLPATVDICGAHDPGQPLVQCEVCGAYRQLNRPHQYQPVVPEAAARVMSEVLPVGEARVMVLCRWPAERPQPFHPKGVRFPMINSKVPDFTDIELIIDGKRILNIEGIRFTAKAGEPVRLSVDFIGAEVQVEMPLQTPATPVTAQTDDPLPGPPDSYPQ